MESMNCGYLCPYEKGTEKISVCDDILKMKSDSFQVDMEPLSHLTNNNKDTTFNSRFSLQRCSSRKEEEKKMRNRSVDDERDAICSPKAIMSEKSIPVTTGIGEPQHHQISIMTATTVDSPTKSRLLGKRSSSFKQTLINPRRIMFFFASLSSMGTILLIYFTLSMAKHKGDDNLLDQ